MPFQIHTPAPDLTIDAWVVTEWSGEIANLAPDEHDEIGWFGLGDLAALELADDTLTGLLAAALERHHLRS